MITTAFIAIFAFAYSIYQISRASGSWRKFNPLLVPVLPFILFIIGTAAVVGMLIGLYIISVKNGLIP
jgi:hypothetical protein